jgi:hypothetical protein
MSDLSLAFRSLRATPEVSAVAALSLALGTVTIAGASFLFGTVGALAGWLLAYRASRIDPAEVLRDSSPEMQIAECCLLIYFAICILQSAILPCLDILHMARPAYVGCLGLRTRPTFSRGRSIS